MSNIIAKRQLQVGDIVQLRSGGPEMTITGVYLNDHEVEVSWFVKRQYHAEDMPTGALIMVRPIEDVI